MPEKRNWLKIQEEKVNLGDSLDQVSQKLHEDDKGNILCSRI